MNRKFIGVVLALAGTVFILILSISAQDIWPYFPAPPSPDTATLHEPSDATRTPSPRMFAPNDNVGPTVTPIPFKRIIDVNPDIPITDEVTIIIRKENGDFWEVFASPDQFQDGPLLPQLIRLHPRSGLVSTDSIIDVAPPASLMGKRPPAKP